MMRECLPTTEHPYNQQSQVGHQFHGRTKERPDKVDPIVDLDNPMIGSPESFDLALLLGKRLDDPDAGDRIGQHARHVSPSDARQSKVSSQSGANPIHEPNDN